MTHAALRSDVDDRYTLFKEDFWSDEWVWAWFRGNATDRIGTVAQTDHHLDLMARLLDGLAGPYMEEEGLFLENLIVADDGTVDRQHGGGIERVVEIVCARLSGSFVKMNHLSARDDFDMSKELSNHRVERLHHWTAVEYLVRSR